MAACISGRRDGSSIAWAISHLACCVPAMTAFACDYPPFDAKITGKILKTTDLPSRTLADDTELVSQAQRPVSVVSAPLPQGAWVPA